MKTTLLIGASWLALTGPAWGSGNDHFNAGIDAGRPGSSFGSSVSTNSTASNVDRGSNGLTQRDREVMASLTNSAWGTLVSIENNRAKYQDGNRTYYVDVAPKPTPKPPVARRAVPPAPAPAPSVDMGTISAPPLSPAAWEPAPMPAQIAPAMPDLQAPPLALPVPAARKRPGYAGVEQTLRARLPVDTRLSGAKLRRKGEETTAAVVNAGIGFVYGAAFGAAPGGGKVMRHGTVAGMVENGALVALASEARRRRNGGVTPYDKDIRGVMNYNDRQIRQAARDMEGHMTPRQVERFTNAFKKERRQYEAHERAAARQDNRQRTHGR